MKTADLSKHNKFNFCDKKAAFGSLNKMFKIRHLAVLLIKKFHWWVVFHKNLSIKESMTIIQQSNSQKAGLYGLDTNWTNQLQSLSGVSGMNLDNVEHFSQCPLFHIFGIEE